MLIRFVVENFLSFNEEVEFNMLAGNMKNHKKHVSNQNNLDILKASVIYGANGAGKSNLIKGIDFFKTAISEGKLTKSVNSKKFKLNSENKEKPVTFEIEFSVNEKIYSYGVSINNSIVLNEWLYETGINKDKLVFEREFKDGKQHIKIANKYTRSQKSKLLIKLMEENLLANNELFLGKSETLKIEEISIIRGYLNNKIVIIYPNSTFSGLITSIISSKEFHTFSNELLETFDTGVQSLEVETVDFDKFFGDDEKIIKDDILESFENNEKSNIVLSFEKGTVLIVKENEKIVVKKISSSHIDNLENKILFDVNDESDGTKRLLDFIPAFHGILNDNITFIVDEIDQSLHPALLYSLVKKIVSDENTKGQFIFTTHESNLLDFDIFRQDEIWFVKKNKSTGSSHIYSLEEFKPRNDLDIRKGYLKGRFGAIPFLANLENLNWDKNNA